VIEKLKKMLDHERKQLRGARLQYQREMSSKTELEHLLRETVETVKTEKKNQRKQSAHVGGGMSSNKFIAAGNLITGHDIEELSDLSQ
jgi:hypothetical protein